MGARGGSFVERFEAAAGAEHLFSRGLWLGRSLGLVALRAWSGMRGLFGAHR